LLVASETELIGLYFDDHAHVPAGRSTLDPSRNRYARIVLWQPVMAYFATDKGGRTVERQLATR
jgi:hypothetical protein